VIVGAEDGLIPHYRHTAAETLAEERRLCYAGMTGAASTSSSRWRACGGSGGTWPSGPRRGSFARPA
jgi:superfamily I DNA/RNA helicase